MRIFTRFIAEDRFHDAHIASLDAACAEPGGYTRSYVEAVLSVARSDLASFEANPVSTVGEGYQIQHRIGARIAETRRLKGIVRECDVLLTGIPCEFDEAATELAAWLEEAGSTFELSVDYALRGLAA